MRRRLCLLALLLACLLLSACGAAAGGGAAADDAAIGHMELQYAQQFSVDYYEGGRALLTVAGAERYWLLARDAALPAGAEDLPVIRCPVEKVYLASSSVADLFLQLDALDSVALTSTTAANWRLPELRQAVETEKILYAGKYSAPDFELLLSQGCDLAVENTMILHSPEIREKLEALGLPVIVEYSSYEPHPLGRVEWIKLYGLLIGQEEAAFRFFDEQIESLAALPAPESTGKTVAFFHINPNGAVVIRKPADYVTRMIELAGGVYPFSQVPGEDNALSTLNMQMEAFYAQARDADVLIYNSTVDGEIFTVEQLLQKSALLGDFKAVQEGKVWCTEQNMFQQTSAAAGMIRDISAILGEEEPDSLQYLHKVE